MTTASLTRAVGARIAAGATIRYAIGTCSLGRVLAAQSGSGVCAVLFGEDDDALADDLRRRFTGAAIVADADGLVEILDEIVLFLDAPDGEFGRPLDMAGTEFQCRVWRALRSIPVGTTASYTDVASRIGAPKSARAVAHACAANPLAVVVPCHRVVRADGGLSGYRWGVERKRALLAREAGA